MFVLIALVALGACNEPPVPSDDKKQEEQPSPYAGTWSYTKIELDNGTLMYGQTPFGTFSGVGENIIGTVEIKENPDSFTTEVQFTAKLDINVQQQNIQQQIPVDKTSSSGTWEEKNGEIVIKPSDGSTIEIISSTENKIVYKGNFDQQVTFGQFTLDANSDVTFTIEK